MAEYKADFIRIPPAASGPQTMPVEPGRRIPESEVRIEMCTVEDAGKIAEGLYATLSTTFWNKMEPLDRRPDLDTRVRRMTKRIIPTFQIPSLKWIKAVLVSTGEIVGIAGWMAPGNPVHTHLRRSAIYFYGFKESMGWSEEEIDEMWEHVSDEAWDGEISMSDQLRKDILGDEPHWHLAPLMTWPAYQGRGIGKRLLDWAIEQADATDPPTPMFLESAPHARAVYMHCGFVPQGESNMVRRGPAIVRGLEADDERLE